MQQHNVFMQLALSLAESAAAYDEVPVGALLVDSQQRIISSAFNLKERNSCPTQHAEILAIESACKKLKSWRLLNCQLYVTLEPCLMCAGAISQARIEKVIYAASDPKAGALGSLYQVHQDKRLNHQFEVMPGVFAAEAGQLLSQFFRNKRRN
ncbi:MAG: tRNA adenosine(34) deaminase TadA [Oligoflexales bacterium]|nr:tRNA adenosine(34) deaminase TadA [Oligoflexales bacterium]